MNTQFSKATWVPIPCILVRAEKRRGCARAGIPLKLAWALTIHKAQGITEPEGTITSFEGSRMPRAVSKMGLALVAWTRATNWARVAFRQLPPLEEFLALRMSRDFKARQKFEAIADAKHDAFLLSRGVQPLAHMEAHKEHLRRVVRDQYNRDVTDAEIRDVETMLSLRGVAPVSESVERLAGQSTGRKSSEGLWTIVESFRADTALKKRTAGGRGGKRQGAPALDGVGIARAILQEHGYASADVEVALRACGPDVDQCVEFCLRAASGAGVSADPPAAGGARSAGSEDTSAFDAIVRLGYDCEVITRILEKCDFSFVSALKCVLMGGDTDRIRHGGGHCFRRQTAKKDIGTSSVQRLFGLSVRQQYEQRSQESLGVSVVPVDLGQHAGGTTAACFWLSLAAGLSRTTWAMPRAASAFADAPLSLLHDVASMTLEDMNVGCGSKALNDTPVGRLAYMLRAYMCHGPSAVLLRPSVIARIYPAFALLATTANRQQITHYKRWVERLGSSEYADELVIHAVVHELGVCIRVVPYTPATSRAPWRIPEYRPEGARERPAPEVLLGNNDVHYVWLSSA